MNWVAVISAILIALGAAGAFLGGMTELGMQLLAAAGAAAAGAVGLKVGEKKGEAKEKAKSEEVAE